MRWDPVRRPGNGHRGPHRRQATPSAGKTVEALRHEAPGRVAYEQRNRDLDPHLLRQTRESCSDAGESTPDLFANFNGLPRGAAKTDFYQHDQNWSNRMILGDSL